MSIPGKFAKIDGQSADGNETSTANAQKKFDEAYQASRSLLNQYNETKAAAAKEEEITIFSLAEEVTVIGQTPLIDVKTTVKGVILTKETFLRPSPLGKNIGPEK